ncbi:MAG: ABC transporter ATP-binding protein [Actinomycetota bacterium]|nr:ABC transporter ATP-binding protein [Actinomycetota bacterium]MDH5223501.1 ABC transporter ATP-binding protein [Actinomycetota bacterium]MDH5313151.1 ABC transporter ATP-binding protein [Actinomycetota bacterium]
MTAFIRVEDVSKAFLEGSLERRVLRGADLEIRRGEMTSLVGASGSGKSTLISLLAGLMLPDSGRVVFDGDAITDMDDVSRAELRARRVGIVLQSGNLIPFLTATQNVELALELGGQRDGARAVELLTELGLGDRLDHLPRRMSGGESQRVSMAVALANHPDLLLADEVTGQLDSASAERVLDIIFDAWRRRGLTVLFVTHNPELAARAERRLVLDRGEVRDL